jgi:hypothetical protein
MTIRKTAFGIYLKPTFPLHFPLWEPLFREVEDRFNDLCKCMEDTYTAIERNQPQKEYAEQAYKTNYPRFLFQRRNGTVKSAREYLRKSISFGVLKEMLGMPHYTITTWAYMESYALEDFYYGNHPYA